MRRMIAIIIILSSLIGCLYAEEEAEQLTFRLLTAEQYKLNASISTSIGRFYANLEFSVDKEELTEADYYSFFFTKSAYLERLKIDGQSVAYSYTRNLDPQHFIPELEQAELLEADSEVYCVSLAKELFADKKGSIKISLEYKMILPEWTAAEDGRSKLEWNTKDFFYPRNLLAVAELDLEIMTTIFHTMDHAQSIQDTGTMRTIKHKIVDIPSIENKFAIYKVLN